MVYRFDVFSFCVIEVVEVTIKYRLGEVKQIKDQDVHGVRRAHTSLNVDLHLLFGTTCTTHQRTGNGVSWAWSLSWNERYDVRVHVLAVLYQRRVTHDFGQVV